MAQVRADVESIGTSLEPVGDAMTTPADTAATARRQVHLETRGTIADQVGEFELAVARMANDPAMGVGEALELLGLVWLNPLLRYEGFEPRAAGMRALLPHVDELRPVHNLESLEDLCKALLEPPARSSLDRSGGAGTTAEQLHQAAGRRQCGPGRRPHRRCAAP